MALRRCFSDFRWSAATANGSWVHFHDGLQQFLSHATRSLSSVAVPLEEKKMEPVDVREEKWCELPPVPKAVPMPVPVRRSWMQRLSDVDGSHDEGLKYEDDVGVQQLTALRWVAKCCPSVTNSLIQKLFRLRQIRIRSPPKMEYLQRLRDDSDAQKQRGSLKRCRKTFLPTQAKNKRCLSCRISVLVSGKAILEEGAVLYVPKSVFQLENAEYLKYQKKKAEHQPTTDEISWLQSLVIYKDSQLLVINKPPGLPVQGGRDVRRSLDSLMGTALRYEYNEGPRLVHRLDKETSGTMVLARTQESATFLHALFRKKTASASSPSRTDNEANSMGRSYLALVIGVPRKLEGRISSSLIKMVVDNGKAEKIMVADDESSEGAQVAITDYKVVGPSNFGCTWLELRPLTGRKHQLRVHCAEVLGTPVVGDFKYGWKSYRSWKEHLLLQNPETWSLAEGFIQEGWNNLEVLGHWKKVRGSVLSKDLMLHLHCHELTLPDPAKLLEIGHSTIDERNWARSLRFVSPLPPHMHVSKRVLRVV